MASIFTLVLSSTLFITSGCIIRPRSQQLGRPREKWEKPCCVSGALMSEKVLCPETHLRHLPGKLSNTIKIIDKLMNKTKQRVNNTEFVNFLYNSTQAGISMNVDSRPTNLDQMIGPMEQDFFTLTLIAAFWEKMIKDETLEINKMNEEFRNTTMELYSSMCSLSWLLKSLGYRIHRLPTSTDIDKFENEDQAQHRYYRNFRMIHTTKCFLKSLEQKYKKFANSSTHLFEM